MYMCAQIRVFNVLVYMCVCVHVATVMCVRDCKPYTWLSDSARDAWSSAPKLLSDNYVVGS